MDKMENALKEISEEYCNLEGVIPETAVEKYLLVILKRMYDISKESLGINE